MNENFANRETKEACEWLRAGHNWRRKVVAEVARQLHSEYGEPPMHLGGLPCALLLTAYSKVRWRQIAEAVTPEVAPRPKNLVSLIQLTGGCDYGHLWGFWSRNLAVAQMKIDTHYCLDAPEEMPAGSTVKEPTPEGLQKRGYYKWFISLRTVPRENE
jgi:hypothetical protein